MQSDTQHSIVAGLVCGIASTFAPEVVSDLEKLVVAVITGLVSGAAYKLGAWLMHKLVKVEKK